MGWGNPTPRADLKRWHAEKVRLTAELDKARATLDTVQRVIDRSGALVPRSLLVVALGDPRRCPMCFSPYSECPVHR